MKRRLLLLLLTLSMLFSLVACGGETDTPVTPIPEPDPVEYTANLLFAGDTLVHKPQWIDALACGNGKTYDFSYCLQYVAPYVTAADLAICNLETTFCDGKEYLSYPTFNTPVSYGEELKNIGFDMVTTANNHSWDTAFTGLVNTLDHLDEIGLDHVGTYRSQEEYDETHGIKVKIVNGISIAFLDFTYGLNGFKLGDKTFAVNVFNTDYYTTLANADYAMLDETMAYANTLEVDCIIVMMHWGVEYMTTENKYQDTLADYFISKGALAVIGGHSHCPQPLMTRTVTLPDGTKKTGFVCYSLGNFTSNQIREADSVQFQHTDETAVLQIQLKQIDDGEVWIEDVSYVPFLMARLSTASTPRYYLLDCHDMIAKYEAGTAPSFVSADIYNRMTRCVNDCAKIFGSGYDKQLTTGANNG